MMNNRQLRWGIVSIATMLILFLGHQAFAGKTLSKDIAPDVPVETLQTLNQASAVYYEGSGKKDVILIADVFCENSRKAYGLMKKNLQYIRSISVLWVSRYSQLGSDIVAAHVMRMHSLGKGLTALEAAFDFEVPQEAGFKGRRQSIDFVKNTFQVQLGEHEKPDTLAELQRVVDNTNLAEDIGYDGTPHFIADRRVLHGYSRAAIKIMLRKDN